MRAVYAWVVALVSARRTSPLFALMRGKGDKEVCGGATNKPQHIGGITYGARESARRKERENDRESWERSKEQDSLNFFLNNIRLFIRYKCSVLQSTCLLHSYKEALCRRVQQIAQIAFYLTSHSQTLYCILSYRGNLRCESNCVSRVKSYKPSINIA